MNTLSLVIISILITWFLITSIMKIKNPHFTYGGNKFRNKIATPVFFIIPSVLLSIVLINEL